MSFFNLYKRNQPILKLESFYNFFFLFLSSYFLISIIINFIQSKDGLFFNLNDKNSLLLVIFGTIILTVITFFISIYLNLKSSFDIFSSIMGMYLIHSVLIAPSPTIVLGFLLLQIIMLSNLIWKKNKLKYLYFTILCFSIVKLITIFNHNGEHLQKFNYNLQEIDFTLINNTIYALIFSFASILCIFLISKYNIINLNNKIFMKLLFIVTIFISFFTLLYVSLIMFGKDATMNFATFDKGLFSQMFESMRQGFGPMTTLERDKWMSHFNVHISPIFYLMLPVYYLIPRSETLEVLQVLVTFSGIIPFYLILNHFNFNKNIKMLFILIYVFTPTLSSAHLYGLHENCFLTPMIFWLILANIKQWRFLLILILFLTFMIKEDIMIYITSIGLFFILQDFIDFTIKRKIFIFITQLLIPIIYFICCLYYLNNFGDGSMVNRFTNFMLPGQDSLLNVVQNIITNPTYFFSALFTFNKIKYLFTILIALAFLPLLQAKLSNYILLVPLLVINLLSDFPYQVNFGFQYHYGSTALLLFLSVLSIYYFKNTQRSFNFQKIDKMKLIYIFLMVSIIMSITIFYTIMRPAEIGIKNYYNDPLKYEARKDTLRQIPKNSKVLAYDIYTTPLAYISELYDLNYHNNKKIDTSIDFIAIPRQLLTDGSEESLLISEYINAGYEESNISSTEILILMK